MSSQTPRRAGLRAAAGLLALVVALVAVPASAAVAPQSDGGIWGPLLQGEVSKVRQESVLDIFRRAASGSAWLMAEGLDPRLQNRPPWDVLTRLRLRDLETSLADASIPTQAGGGVLVPFRDRAPSFTRLAARGRPRGAADGLFRPCLSRLLPRRRSTPTGFLMMRRSRLRLSGLPMSREMYSFLGAGVFARLPKFLALLFMDQRTPSMGTAPALIHRGARKVTYPLGSGGRGSVRSWELSRRSILSKQTVRRPAVPAAMNRRGACFPR